jgi:programmed cell death 8 (apoptosis-inducing factor)
LDDYSKGVVFYHNTDGRIVGVLTWNLFGKMDAARKVLLRA